MIYLFDTNQKRKSIFIFPLCKTQNHKIVMGTIQSSENGSSSDRNAAFDFVNRICFCEGQVEETSTTTTHLNSLESNLQRLHNTKGPYLGTSGWESLDFFPTAATQNEIKIQQSTEEEEEALDWDADENDCILDKSNILDITKDDDISHPPLTPQKLDSPYSNTQHFDQHHIEVLSSSYIHHSPSNVSDDDGGWSASTGRTYTSGSTDATDQKYNQQNGNLYHSKSRDLSISFAPRRLFQSQESMSIDQATRKSTTDKTNATSINVSHSHSKSIIVQNGIFKSLDCCSHSSNEPMYVNTLPSFIQGDPIRLKVRQSYDEYSFTQTTDGGGHLDEALETSDMNNISLLSDAEHAHLFSYDPSFSTGEYCITTMNDDDYGNGLCVKMGAQYMTLQDKDGRVWGIIRSRNTFIPSAIIYSPKERYPGQVPTSHRPSGNESDSVELYPWALVKKHGRRLEHDVSIHMVADPTSTSSFDAETCSNSTSNQKELLGGLFETIPTFWSRHGFDNRHNQVHSDTHTHSVIFHVEKKLDGSSEEVPCCMSVRDMESSTSTFQVTIAPGVDPLIVICYMAAHSKMDVEPNLVGF
jgi:hypothetical protein